MRRQNVNRLLAVCAAGATVLVGGAIAGVGTAEAAQAADGSQLVVLDSCRTTVPGTAGQTTALAPSAVLQPITDVLATLDPLGILTPTFQSAWLALPPIPISSIPVGGQAQNISGSTIANAVTGELGSIPILGPVLNALSPAVWSILAQNCEVDVQPSAEPAPPPPGGGQPYTMPAPPPPPPSQNGVAGARGGATPPTGGAPAPGVPDAPGAGVVAPDRPLTLHNPVNNFGDTAAGLPPDTVPYNFSAGIPNVAAAATPPFDVNALRMAQPRNTGQPESLSSADQTVIGRAMLFGALVLALVITQLTRNRLLRREPRPLGRHAKPGSGGAAKEA